MSNDELLKEAVCEEYNRELETLPSEEELEEMILVSPEFHIKMEKLFKRHKAKTWLLRIGKSVATFLILVACSFLLLLVLNEDVRATCLQWVKTMTKDGMVEYQAILSNTKDKPAAEFVLKYIPEGYVLESADMDTETGFVLYYKGKDPLEFYYTVSEGTTASVNNEDHNFSQMELDDGTVCDFYKSQSDKYSDILIWQKENFICALIGSGIEENELKRIANGVKPANP